VNENILLTVREASVGTDATMSDLKRGEAVYVHWEPATSRVLVE
jgi:hypothetical protein